MNTATVASLQEYIVGQQVFFGRKGGEQSLGEVVKLGPKKLKVKQLDQRGTYRAYPIGTVWSVPPSLCKPVNGVAVPAPVLPKRPDAIILTEIRGLYNQLSPENLHCDGEISRSAAARRGVAFRRRLQACFTELGRKVSSDEAFHTQPV